MRNILTAGTGQRTTLPHIYWSLSKAAGAAIWIRKSVQRKIRSMEEIAEIEERITIEEIQESQRREQLLLKESEGSFPDWSALADQKLVQSLLMLSEEEKDLIYLHVFEERSFNDMSRITGLTPDRCKNIYYYAIRKIRKRMGAKRDEF